MVSILEQLDAAIANFFASWNGYTSLLAGVLVIFLLWPILTGKDPDIHPFLLARQSQASPVRQTGESAVYRASEIPYGYPLRRGLAVKDPGAPKWAAGRDGDLRDVWRQAVQGPVDDKGASSGPRSKLKTILGRELVVDQDLDAVTQSINTIGTYVQDNGGKVVAVCLSNSVELLAALFASAFHDFKSVLVPYGIPQHPLNSLLKQSLADTLIAEAGTLDLKAVIASAPNIKHIIWVAKEGSRHLDWNEVPEGIGGSIDVQTWHELVEDHKAKSTVPALVPDSPAPSPVATFWLAGNGQYEYVEYTQNNLVAAAAGLISTLARSTKLSSSDIFLPTTPLTDSYTLCWTLAALHCGATVALTSVAAPAVNLDVAVMGVRPTIVTTSSNALTQHADKITARGAGFGARMHKFFTRRSLQAGVMPTSKSGSINPNLADLRILLISQPDSETTRVPSSILASLRMAIGARIGYALTTAKVAGAVTQTNILDYRDKGSSVINVGVPLTCLELHLTGTESELQGARPQGRLVVRGPSVVGGRAELAVPAKIDHDHTVELV